MNRNQKQQGDVWMERMESLPDGARKIERKDSVPLVLAHGEHTGNMHAVLDDGVEEFEIAGRRFLVVKEAPATVVHGPNEPHSPVTLEPGVWEFGQVVEKDWLSEMVEKVQD